MKYTKQEKPIYRWTLMSNGVVKKFTPVTEYTIREHGNQFRVDMRQADGQGRNSVRGEKFDCFKNNTVYSFNGDDSRALKMIRDALEAKVHMAKKEYDRALEDLAKFHAANL